jgi:hypothetical protein
VVLLVLALLYVGACRLNISAISPAILLARFCGLARIPTARTVANWLRQFTHATLAPLVQFNHDLVTDAIARLQLPRLRIDVDGTVIRTGATVAWVFRGFNPHHRKDPNYYLLLALRLARSDILIGRRGETRGNGQPFIGPVIDLDEQGHLVVRGGLGESHVVSTEKICLCD